MAKLALRLTSLANVARVHVQFDTMTRTCVGTQEFLRRVVSPKLAKTNPKCEITWDTVETRADPFVSFDFEDGTKARVESANMQWQEIAEVLNDSVLKIKVAAKREAHEKYAKEGGKKR